MSYSEKIIKVSKQKEQVQYSKMQNKNYKKALLVLQVYKQKV